MSYRSVVSAFTTLVNANVAGIKTILNEREMWRGGLPAAQCPALILSRNNEQNTPFTEESGQRVWWLDVAIWNYYPRLLESVPDFEELQESIKRVALANDDLQGLADTSHEHVIGFGKTHRMKPDVWLPSGIGQVLRNVTVSFQVWESVGW